MVSNRSFLVVIFITIAFLSSQGVVSGQPEWSWKYSDSCMVFAMDINSKGDLAAAFGYYAILLSPDGSRIFKVPTRDLVYSIAVSDNDYVVAGTRGTFIQLFDPSGKLVLEQKTGDQVWAVDISRDGRRFVGGSNDGWLYYFAEGRLVWKANTGAPIWGAILTGKGIVVGNDAGKLVLYSYDGNVVWEKNLNGRIWRVKSDGEYIAVLVLHTGEGVTSEVYLFNLSGAVIWKRRFNDYVRDVDVDNGIVAISGDIGEILTVDRENNTLWEFPNFEPAWSVAIRRGYVLAGGGGENAFFIDPDGTPLWIFEDNLSITTVAMSPDGRYLAVADKTFEEINCMGNIYFLKREIPEMTSSSTLVSSAEKTTSTSSNPTSSVSGTGTTTSATPSASKGLPKLALPAVLVGVLVVLGILLAREMKE